MLAIFLGLLKWFILPPIVELVSPKRRRKRKQQRLDRIRKQAAIAEERNDEIRLDNWKKRHQRIPVSSKDYEELKRLVRDRVASYEKACEVRSITVNPYYIRSIKSELERDWDV